MDAPQTDQRNDKHVFLEHVDGYFAPASHFRVAPERIGERFGKFSVERGGGILQDQALGLDVVFFPDSSDDRRHFLIGLFVRVVYAQPRVEA